MLSKSAMLLLANHILEDWIGDKVDVLSEQEEEILEFAKQIQDEFMEGYE